MHYTRGPKVGWTNCFRSQVASVCCMSQSAWQETLPGERMSHSRAAVLVPPGRVGWAFESAKRGDRPIWAARWLYAQQGRARRWHKRAFKRLDPSVSMPAALGAPLVKAAKNGMLPERLVYDGPRAGIAGPWFATTCTARAALVHQFDSNKANSRASKISINIATAVIGTVEEIYFIFILVVTWLWCVILSYVFGGPTFLIFPRLSMH